MVFTWYCRLHTEDDIKVINETRIRNDTSVPLRCLNKEWNETQVLATGIFYLILMIFWCILKHISIKKLSDYRIDGCIGSEWPSN